MVDSTNLVPGAGHMDKVLLDVIFKACPHIFFELLAKSLEFRIKKAVDFVIIVVTINIKLQIARIVTEAFVGSLSISMFCTVNKVGFLKRLQIT